MLLTLTYRASPATDLGYLLHKNPQRAHAFELSFGRAHVFYPEATGERCTAALLLEVDAVGLVRGRRGAADGAPLASYVNDRPYVGSSFLSVALGKIFGTALGGRSKERPELAARALPLEARLAVIPCREGETLLRRLFEPLGYSVHAQPHALDEQQPSWGASRYFTLTLTGTQRLCDLLTHLYVLVPVLDDDKHYWVGDDEVDKLVRRGAGWLAEHPERDLIAHRYLKHRRSLARQAVDRLVAEEVPSIEALEVTQPERKQRLDEQRIAAVVGELKRCGATRVLDLGCGEGRLVQALLADSAFRQVVGMDVSQRALERAHRRLNVEQLPEATRARLALWTGSLLYRDARLAGYDAAAIVEVIEHLDLPRLAAFERSVFEYARPLTVIVTTPNAEYNVKYGEGGPRHADHRFEWTRSELARWAEVVATRAGYGVRIVPVGEEDTALGAPTQMAVFSR